jgi:Na+-transporting NADH:ubiquinone oxidoreductase subunit NqrC
MASWFNPLTILLYPLLLSILTWTATPLVAVTILQKVQQARKDCDKSTQILRVTRFCRLEGVFSGHD